MPPARRSGRSRAASVSADIRQVVVWNVVAEARGVAVEGQALGADRAVALLGDDHLGQAVDLLAAALPALVALLILVVRLRLAPLRLGALQVVLLAEHEHDDVGVLL